MTEINYTDLTKTQLWAQHQKPMAAPHTNPVPKMWTESIILGIGVYITWVVYIYFAIGQLSPLTFSIAAATTGAILIGISFALSGLCFYFNFLDKKIAYRKYIGLVGYYFALGYALSLLFLNPQKYLYGLSESIFTPDVYLGLTAISILSFMALISNNWAMKTMSMKWWKLGLRLGYLAYLLLIIRATVLDHEIWLRWFQELSSLPPPRLLISIFAAAVILLRLSIIFVKKEKAST